MKALEDRTLKIRKVSCAIFYRNKYTQDTFFLVFFAIIIWFFFNCKLALRGLGDLACCSDSILNKYSSDAIQAAMAGLDDSDDRRDEVCYRSIYK